MMRRAVALVLLGTFFFASGASAQMVDSYTSKVGQVMERSNVTGMLGSSAESLTAPVTTMLELSLKLPKEKGGRGLSDEQAKRISALYTQLFKQRLAQAMPQLVAAVVPAYQKYFTEADLDAVIAFYQSPAGQKMALYAPQLMQDVATNVQPVMTQVMESSLQDFKNQMRAQAQ